MTFHQTVYTCLSGSPDGATVAEIASKVQESFPRAHSGRVGAVLCLFVLERWARVDGELFCVPGPRPVIWGAL